MAIGEVTYSPTEWVNGETPLNQTNMNNIEGGVAACASGVNSLIEDVNTIPRVTNSELTIHDTIKLSKIGSEDSTLNQVSITPKSNSTTDWDIEVKSSGGYSPTVNVKSDTENVAANLSVSGRISSDSINTNSIAGSSQITMKSSESLSGTTVISAGNNKLVVGASGTPAKISNVADPTVGNDAANKDYVDGGLSLKQNSTDTSLSTSNQTIVGAINELNSGKVSVESGKGLSANDFTGYYKNFLDDIMDGNLPSLNGVLVSSSEYTTSISPSSIAVLSEDSRNCTTVSSAGVSMQLGDVNSVNVAPVSRDGNISICFQDSSSDPVSVSGVADPTDNTDAANKKYVDDGLSLKQNVITNSLTIGDVKISADNTATLSLDSDGPARINGVRPPENNDDAANKDYVDSVPTTNTYTLNGTSQTIQSAINSLGSTKQTSGQPVSIFDDGGVQLSVIGPENTLVLAALDDEGTVLDDMPVYITGVDIREGPSDFDVANVKYVNDGLSRKQDANDNNLLTTTSKNIVGAINEINESKQSKIESSIALRDSDGITLIEIKNSGNSTVSFSDVASGSDSGKNVVLSGVASPTDDDDAANKKYVDDKFSASEEYAADVPINNSYDNLNTNLKTITGAINEVNGKFNSLVGDSYDAELKLRSVECYNTEGANSEKSTIDPFSISVETYEEGYNKSTLSPGEVLLTKDVDGVTSEVTVSADSVGDDGDVTAIRMYCENSSDNSVVLTGVAEPISDVDAANKHYVDSGLSGKQDKNSNDIRLYSHSDNYVKLSSNENVVSMSYTYYEGTSDVYITGVGNPTSPNGVCNKGYVDTKLDEKQNSTDNSLSTSDKTVVGAINELKNGYETAIVASVPYDHSEVAYFFGRYLILYNKDRMSSYGDMKLSRAMFGDSTRVLVRQLSSPSTVVTTLELQEDPDTGETIFPSIKDNQSLVNYTQYIIQRDFTV